MSIEPVGVSVPPNSNSSGPFLSLPLRSRPSSHIGYTTTCSTYTSSRQGYHPATSISSDSILWPHSVIVSPGAFQALTGSLPLNYCSLGPNSPPTGDPPPESLSPALCTSLHSPDGWRRSIWWIPLALSASCLWGSRSTLTSLSHWFVIRGLFWTCVFRASRGQGNGSGRVQRGRRDPRVGIWRWTIEDDYWALVLQELGTLSFPNKVLIGAVSWGSQSWHGHNITTKRHTFQS